MLKYLKLFEQFLTEKKPKGAPNFHHSDAPDAEGRFKDLSIKDLAAWLIKTRKKDVKKISGSLTQQIVFNRKSDPKYAEKMEKTRKEVYKQLGREDLLKESFESLNKKVQFLRLTPVKSYTDNKALVKLTEDANERFYEEHILKKDGKYTDFDKLKETLKSDRPILYYGAKSGESSKFINEYIKEHNNVVYNKPDEQQKSGDKVKFHKALDGTDLTPKTVFNIKEAEKLKFPIIAKPAEGMSGIGIEKFETIDDLKKSKGKFDLFSEFVNFDREYRGLFVKDKLAVVYERVPIIEDDKSIETKSRDEKLSFVYIEQKDKLPFTKELMEMAKTFNDKVKLDVYSLDFFSTKNEGLSLIEANASSGLGSNSLVSVYEAIHEDFYDKKIAKEDREFIDKIKESYNSHIKTDYPSEYKKSLLPK